MMWRSLAGLLDQVVVGGLQAGVDVRLPVGLEAERVLQADEVDRSGAHRPVGALVEGHHAELVGRRERVGGAQDRLLGDVDLLEAARPAGCAVPRLSPVQWQSAMLPLLSTTATIATSGERSRSRTVM